MQTIFVFTKTAAISAAAMLLGFALPAQAQPAADNGGSKAASSDSNAASSGASRIYCIRDTLIGSRVPRKVCKTKAEWAAEGVDLK